MIRVFSVNVLAIVFSVLIISSLLNISYFSDLLFHHDQQIVFCSYDEDGIVVWI